MCKDYLFYSINIFSLELWLRSLNRFKDLLKNENLEQLYRNTLQKKNLKNSPSRTRANLNGTIWEAIALKKKESSKLVHPVENPKVTNIKKIWSKWEPSPFLKSVTKYRWTSPVFTELQKLINVWYFSQY